MPRHFKPACREDWALKREWRDAGFNGPSKQWLHQRTWSPPLDESAAAGAEFERLILACLASRQSRAANFVPWLCLRNANGKGDVMLRDASFGARYLEFKLKRSTENRKMTDDWDAPIRVAYFSNLAGIIDA